MFYAIAKILEYQDRRREERRRQEERERMLEEAYIEGFDKGFREVIDLVLDSPVWEQYPEVRERFKQRVESTMEENRRSRSRLSVRVCPQTSLKQNTVT